MQRAIRVDKDGQHKFSHYTKICGDKVIVCAVNESCWFSVNRILDTVRKCRPYECQDGVCIACGSFYEDKFGNILWYLGTSLAGIVTGMRCTLTRVWLTLLNRGKSMGAKAPSYIILIMARFFYCVV
jgi:hypothetical protein